MQKQILLTSFDEDESNNQGKNYILKMSYFFSGIPSLKLLVLIKNTMHQYSLINQIMHTKFESCLTFEIIRRRVQDLHQGGRIQSDRDRSYTPIKRFLTVPIPHHFIQRRNIFQTRAFLSEVAEKRRA